ncbi:MAG: tail length tape measure protein [Malazfec virus 1]
MDEQKIIDIKVQVDTSDVDKSFKDIAKQSEKTSDKVNKSSKKMNDTMVKDAKKSTDKLTKQFQDLQKQMTKALDSTKLGKQLNSTLSKVKAQLTNTLGNIDITANVRTNSQQQGNTSNANQSQIEVGSLLATGAVGATLQEQLSKTKGEFENLKSSVKVEELFDGLDDGFKTQMDTIKSQIEVVRDYLAEMGEDLSFKEANASVQSLISSLEQIGSKLGTVTTKGDFLAIRREIDAVVSSLHGMTPEVSDAVYELEKIIKITRSNRGGDALISDVEVKKLSAIKDILPTVTSEVQQMGNATSKLAVFEEVGNSVPKLQALVNTFKQMPTKANAIPLVEELQRLGAIADQAGLHLTGLEQIINQYNTIMSNGTKLTSHFKTNLLGFSNSIIQTVNAERQLAQQTVAYNTAMTRANNSSSALERALNKAKASMIGLSQTYQTYAPKISSLIDKIKTKTTQWWNTHVKASKGIDGANKKVASSFKSLLNAMLPFLSIYAVFNGLKNAINDAMESIETDNMFNTVFGSSSKEMNDWVSEVNKTLGLGITNTKQYTATISQMGRAMGLTGTQAKDMSQKMALMAGDISSFYDTDIANIQADLRSALSGSFEVKRSLPLHTETYVN